MQFIIYWLMLQIYDHGYGSCDLKTLSDIVRVLTENFLLLMIQNKLLIQNKSLSLHYISLCTVYIYYVFICMQIF